MPKKCCVMMCPEEVGELGTNGPLMCARHWLELPGWMQDAVTNLTKLLAMNPQNRQIFNNYIRVVRAALAVIDAKSDPRQHRTAATRRLTRMTTVH